MSLQLLKNFAITAIALLTAIVSSPALSQFKIQNMDVSLFNNTNVGLARTDHMRDYGVQVRLAAQGYYEQSTGTGVFISTEFSSTKYETYKNLDRTEISGQIGYVKKLGIGFDKPRISAILGIQHRSSDSEIRSGWSLSPRLQYSKNLTDRMMVGANLTYYQFEADSRIAVEAGVPGWIYSDENPTSIQNLQLHIGSEWAWTADTYLAFDTTFVNGEFSSMALPSSGLSAYASAVSRDDVCGTSYYNYRYTGQGAIAAVAITHVFSEDYDSTFRFQRTYVDADSGKGYGQNLINLSISKRF